MWIGSVSGVPSKGRETGERVPSGENIGIFIWNKRRRRKCKLQIEKLQTAMLKM